MQEEVWKEIEWWKLKRYQLSNLWSLKSICNCKERILIWRESSRWYIQYHLDKKNVSIHRLVAEHFIENIGNKPEVNHIDWNKLNNKVNNLEWCTKSENAKHAFRTWLRKSNLLFWFSESNKWWKSKRFKKVIQKSIDWKILKNWDSIKEASRSLWIIDTSISRNCKWKWKSAWWFIWEYD